MKPYGNLDMFWSSYLDLERNFIEFTHLVPLVPEHSKVTSPRLADLASSIGNWTETIFKRVTDHGGHPQYPVANVPISRQIKINEFCRAFEAYYRLSRQRVFVKRYLTQFYTVLRPFAAFRKQQNPDWFRIYSRYKHNRIELQQMMTFRKTAEALAGLFLLNVYPYEMRELLCELGVIRSRFGTSVGAAGGALLYTLKSHPNKLEGKMIQFVGSVIAETSMFSFEFPRITSLKDHSERPSELYHQWRSQGPQRP